MSYIKCLAARSAPLFTRRSHHTCLHGGPVPPLPRRYVWTRPRGEGDP